MHNPTTFNLEPMNATTRMGGTHDDAHAHEPPSQCNNEVRGTHDAPDDFSTIAE
jgi:hypothetical protein